MLWRQSKYKVLFDKKWYNCTKLLKNKIYFGYKFMILKKIQAMMLGKIILFVYLILLNCASCQAQYFNGKIYQILENSPTDMTISLAEMLNVPETELLFNNRETIFCNDTLIRRTYGFDSLYSEVLVQIGSLNYLFLGEDGFVPIRYDSGFYSGEWERRKIKSNKYLLGFKTDKYEYVKNKITKEYFVIKEMNFKDSYAVGNYFTGFFYSNGLILENNFFAGIRETSLKTIKIVIEKCNCYKELKELKFFDEKRDSEELLDLDKFLNGGN